MEKLKIISNIPLSDEQIISNTPFEFKINKNLFKIKQFTYKKYFEFNKQLHIIGADVLGYPDEKIINDTEIKDNWTEWLKSNNDRIYWLINIIINYSDFNLTGLKKYLPRIIQKIFVKKYIVKNIYMGDILVIFETLLKFNFTIKKKLQDILTTNPEKNQAENIISETLQGLSPKHLEIVKNGTMIPRYCN